ncbi:ribosome hibernation-promoting factor, HPF/YfiA family [Sunxiuqinia dokdonensis]|uniref:RNA polymerase subunit sigma-54 n=1 Tax=Sunxiuqinia dokdonensis TaxID=1409788 RepID=A0A0L8V6F1_9BACT|nr:ribosome-associated translation inhibitor RaiA [Sunxiuqinia dokdonensis]KOH43762.1 RNA polymerase subunit sigma-54 [Sunxiuqinia dokdonensis]
MNINLNAVHFTPDQKLVDFANKKLNKLDTFFEGIISAELILKVLKPETADNKIAEIKLSIPANGYLFAKKEADTFEEAIDLAIDAIRRQLTKFKEKLKEK